MTGRATTRYPMTTMLSNLLRPQGQLAGGELMRAWVMNLVVTWVALHRDQETRSIMHSEGV